MCKPSSTAGFWHKAKIFVGSPGMSRRKSLITIGSMPDRQAHSNDGATSASPQNGANWQRGPAWKCSDKQRDLVLKLVEEHQLDKADVEALAVERFGKGVRLLNKVEASGLIDELIDTYGGGRHQGDGKRRNGSAYQRSNGRRAA